MNKKSFGGELYNDIIIDNIKSYSSNDKENTEKWKCGYLPS